MTRSFIKEGHFIYITNFKKVLTLYVFKHVGPQNTHNLGLPLVLNYFDRLLAPKNSRLVHKE